MTRTPPVSTRTAPLFPYTTLFRFWPPVRRQGVGRIVWGAPFLEAGGCLSDLSGKGGRSVFGSDRCTAGNEAGRYKHGQRVKPDRSHDRLPPPIDRASSAPSTVTVTVRPAIRSIPVGTLSIAMRTGKRWARRTDRKSTRLNSSH